MSEAASHLLLLFPPLNLKPWNWNWWNSCSFGSLCSALYGSAKGTRFLLVSCFLLLFILIYGSSFLLFVISYCYYYCWLSFILSISTSNFVHLPFLSWLRRSSYVCEYELVCTSCIWICSLHVSSWLFVFFSSIQHSIQRWYNRNFIRWMRFYIWTGSMLFVEFAALYYHLNLVNLPIL